MQRKLHEARNDFPVNEMRSHVHCFLVAPGQACSDYILKDRLNGFVGCIVSSLLYQHDLWCKSQLVVSLVLISSGVTKILGLKLSCLRFLCQKKSLACTFFLENLWKVFLLWDFCTIWEWWNILAFEHFIN